MTKAKNDMTESEKIIVNALDGALRQRKITNNQLALKTGYSAVQISKWRRGIVSMKFSNLIELCKVAGIEQIVFGNTYIRI